jgi:hypothetical protein
MKKPNSRNIRKSFDWMTSAWRILARKTYFQMRANVFRANVLRENVLRANFLRVNVLRANVIRENVSPVNVFWTIVLWAIVFRDFFFRANVFRENVFLAIVSPRKVIESSPGLPCRKKLKKIILFSEFTRFTLLSRLFLHNFI